MKHIDVADLALFSAGDLSLVRQNVVRWHVMHCRDCASRVELFRMDRDHLRASADRLPENVDWSRLSAEMAANIHLGLEAGECVTPKDRRTPLFKPGEGWAARQFGQIFSAHAWKPAAAVAGLTVVLAGAWWLNMPGSDSQTLLRAFRAIASGQRETMPQRVRLMDDREPVVEVTTAGVAVRQKGSTLAVAQGGARPVAVSVSAQGSASARYVDADTGQVTVTSVYVD